MLDRIQAQLSVTKARFEHLHLTDSKVWGHLNRIKEIYLTTLREKGILLTDSIERVEYILEKNKQKLQKIAKVHKEQLTSKYIDQKTHLMRVVTMSNLFSKQIKMKRNRSRKRCLQDMLVKEQIMN